MEINPLDAWWSWMRRYFPAFMGTLLIAKLSIALAISAITSVHFTEITPDITFLIMATMTSILVMTNFFLVRGFPRTTIINKTIFFLCLTVSSSAVIIDPNFGLFLGTISPILGLLIMHTQRYRALPGYFIYIRQQRQIHQELLKSIKQKK